MDDKGYYEFTCVYPEAYTITLRTAHSEGAFDELCEAFRAFALAAGYHPDTVNDVFDPGAPSAEPRSKPVKKGGRA